MATGYNFRVFTEICRRVISGTLGFRRAFLAYFVVFGICTLVYYLTKIALAVNLETLAASTSTPWGVFTSVFTHLSLQHLFLNMVGLLWFVCLFAVCNSMFPRAEKRRIEVFFLVTVFASAVAANVVWVLVISQPSVGASGLMFAMEGSLMAFAFYNGVQLLHFSISKTQKPTVIFVAVLNIVVFLVLLGHFVVEPELFLSLGKGINPIAHSLSFYFASVSTSVWCTWFYLLRKGTPVARTLKQANAHVLG